MGPIAVAARLRQLVKTLRARAQRDDPAGDGLDEVTIYLDAPGVGRPLADLRAARVDRSSHDETRKDERDPWP